MFFAKEAPPLYYRRAPPRPAPNLTSPYRSHYFRSPVCLSVDGTRHRNVFLTTAAVASLHTAVREERIIIIIPPFLYLFSRFN